MGRVAHAQSSSAWGENNSGEPGTINSHAGPYEYGKGGKIDGSGDVASQAATAAADLHSGRVKRELHAAAERLTPYTNESVVGEFRAAV